MMPPLSRANQQHLDAAEGWLGLGACKDAHEELDSISPLFRVHPEVLRMRYDVFAAGKNWYGAMHVAKVISSSEPDSSFGAVHTSYALHELNRTREALAALLPMADKFPGDWQIAYNLACYYCQLNENPLALQWLEKAIGLEGDREDVRSLALEDPDLRPLYSVIRDYP
jgi:tetratricopeptide (TPR) repeat protein